jgi:hypothetical protein
MPPFICFKLTMEGITRKMARGDSTLSGIFWPMWSPSLVLIAPSWCWSDSEGCILEQRGGWWLCCLSLWSLLILVIVMAKCRNRCCVMCALVELRWHIKVYERGLVEAQHEVTQEASK